MSFSLLYQVRTLYNNLIRYVTQQKIFCLLWKKSGKNNSLVYLGLNPGRFHLFSSFPFSWHLSIKGCNSYSSCYYCCYQASYAAMIKLPTHAIAVTQRTLPACGQTCGILIFGRYPIRGIFQISLWQPTRSRRNMKTLWIAYSTVKMCV